MPGAIVKVKNSTIETVTNFDGIFSIQVPDSLNVLEINYVGFLTQEYELSPNQKNVQIVLKQHRGFFWTTVGFNVDPINSMYGFVHSNGFDEYPLVHFEDFTYKAIYKISGQTDFNSRIAFDAKIGVLNPIKHVSLGHVGYTNIYFVEGNFEFQDIYLSLKSRFIKNTALLFKTGYQQLLEEKNVGFNLGVQQEFKNFYAGALAGYYFDYFDFSGYLQYGFFYDNIYSVRIEYRRVDENDFLSLGVHFTLKQF